MVCRHRIRLSRPSGRPGCRALLGALPLALVVLALSASGAQAAIANVQTGTLASASTSSVSVTLPAASTAGTFLVITVTSNVTTAFTTPSGWTAGPTVGTSGSNAGRTAIFYRANNPGGISSVPVADTGASLIDGQMTEWSGVATSSPLETSGTAQPTSTIAPAVSSTAAPAASGDLGITAFGWSGASAKANWTAGSGWTNIAASGGSKAVVQLFSDYRLGLPASTVSETGSSSQTGDWSAAVAVFKPPACSAAGTLTLAAPSSSTFPGLTLNGSATTTTTSVVITTDDETGSGSGWNLTGTSTAFANAGGKTLPASATSITSVTQSAGTGQCSAPTNSVTYPLTLPAGATAPAGAKLYNAAASSGAGQANLTVNAQVTVPASAYNGTYSSTWTFTLSTGP